MIGVQNMLSQLLNGLLIAVTPPTLNWLLIGTGIGLIVGVLPALGATVGVVLFLPFTYGMDLATALVFLMAIYSVGQYGDSVTSILINTPGGPGTVASCWEGYPMTKRGQGARALGIATLGSMIGGVAGCIGLLSLAWPLTEFAMKIGPPEYFALGVMALSLVSIASKGETLKGLIMASVGLSLSFIGVDPVSGFVDRFTFGSVNLAAGIPILTVFLGLFAIVQVFTMLEEGGNITPDPLPQLTIREALLGFLDILRRPITVIRSIGIGMYIGILPALGVTTATITSYLVEKKYSREKEQFGQGAPSGLVAAEVAKGCCVVGDMIPTFTLGIPGSVTGGIIMAAFILHGIQPGPQFLMAGSMPYVVFAGIILAQLLILIIGLPLIKYFTYITKVPNTLLAPLLVVLCFIGAFVERNMTSDIAYLLIFSVFGFVLNRLGYSLISLVIGLILGELIEVNFHRTMGMGYGSLSLLLTRPITLVLFGITFLFLAWPYIKALYLVFKGRASEGGAAIPDSLKIGFSEIILLAILAGMNFIMLVVSKSYPFGAKLFPDIVSYVTLILIVWRLAPLAFKRGRQGYYVSVKFKKAWLSRHTMSWEWSAGMLAGYFLLIYGVGFLGATAIYVIVVPASLRYRNRWMIVSLAIVMTISTALLARVLHVILPSPF